MLRQWSLGLLMIAISSPLLALTPTAVSPVLGFVDIAYLIDNSPQSLKARERLEQEFEPRQKELSELRGEHDREVSRLAGVNAANAEAAQQSGRDRRAAERRLRRLEKAFQEDLNIKRNNELKSVRDRILESVTAFARREGFDLIFTDGVLFASTRMDVTQRVLEQLRKQP